MIRKNFFKKTFMVAALLSLSSCKWLSNNHDDCSSCSSHSHDNSTPIISMNGKALLTEKEFEDMINEIAESNEQARMMMQFMPDFKERILENKKMTLIISQWAKKEGIRNTEEYRKKERKVLESIKDQMDTEEFIKRHQADISDEDALKYYNENKEKDPRIMSSAAGVRASGVSFSDAAKANDFAKKLKENKSKNIDSLAKEQKLNVTSFGVVNEDSFIDKAVKDKLTSLKNTPDVLIVKGENKKYWVVHAKNKEQAAYKTFEEAKEAIKQTLKPQKLEETIVNAIKKLQNDYNITENTQYLESLKNKAQAPQLPEEPADIAPAKELASNKTAD